MTDETLGERIRRARDREGLTQADLAEKVGVTAAAISQWEAGGVPRGVNRSKLEEVLGRLSLPDVVAGGRDQAEPVRVGMDNDVSSFGVWLRNQRALARLSIPELARLSSISAAALYNIESGRIQNPQPRTRDKLARALNQTIPHEVVRETEKDQAITGLGNLTDFEPHEKSDWPACSGVYVLYDSSQRPIYVGKAQKISSRLGNHVNMFWFKDPIVRYGSYVEVKDSTLRHQLEQAMIKFLKANAVINKQSSESFEED